MRIHLRTSNKPQSMQISNGTPLLPLLVQLLRREVHLRGRGEEEGGRGGPWAHFLFGELVSTPPRGPLSIGGACFNNPPGPIFYWGSLFQQPPGAHCLLGSLFQQHPGAHFLLGALTSVSFHGFFFPRRPPARPKQGLEAQQKNPRLSFAPV